MENVSPTGQAGRVETNEAEQRTRDAGPTKRPTVDWTGQFQADGLWFHQDAANRKQFGDIENGSAFRRARLGAFGEYGPSEYRIEADFALVGRPSLLDVYAGIRDVPYLGRVRVGHFFEPFSLGRITSSRNVTFLERPLLDEAFAPARNLGVMASDSWADGNGTWAAGVFATDSDAFGDSVGDAAGVAGTARVTYLPWYDESTGRDYAHVGVAYSVRGANNQTVRFRARPEARIGAAVLNVAFLADTGAIRADLYQLAGAETLIVRGPASAQSEFVLVPVHTLRAETAVLYGWYLQANFMLTGESRPYSKVIGAPDRVRPFRDFLPSHEGHAGSGGLGAWEVSARLSHLDLNDSEIHGGRLTDLTIGLNWYLNPFLRVTANYIRTFPDAVRGDGGTADVFGLRVGFDF